MVLSLTRRTCLIEIAMSYYWVRSSNQRVLFGDQKNSCLIQTLDPHSVRVTLQRSEGDPVTRKLSGDRMKQFLAEVVRFAKKRKRAPWQLFGPSPGATAITDVESFALAAAKKKVKKKVKKTPRKARKTKSKPQVAKKGKKAKKKAKGPSPEVLEDINQMVHGMSQLLRRMQKSQKTADDEVIVKNTRKDYERLKKEVAQYNKTLDR